MYAICVGLMMPVYATGQQAENEEAALVRQRLEHFCRLAGLGKQGLAFLAGRCRKIQNAHALTYALGVYI